jgi:hypothetical protein
MTYDYMFLKRFNKSKFINRNSEYLFICLNFYLKVNGIILITNYFIFF